MKKKVISAMLAAAMIISVTGCGNNGEQKVRKIRPLQEQRQQYRIRRKTVQRRLNSGQTTVMTRHI